MLRARVETIESDYRRGFTIIELMVSLSVIGILVSLIVPAIQQAREAARRTVCTSHLKQIGLAIHGHQEAYQVFPSGIIDREYWNVRVLPFMEEEKPEMDEFGRVVNPGGKTGLFICPSDPFASIVTNENERSYVMNKGHGDHRNDGFYGKNGLTPTSPADFTDGLSSTAAVSERLVLPPQNLRSSAQFDDPVWVRRLVHKTGSFLKDYDAFVDECNTRSILPNYTLFLVSDYNHISPPNGTMCMNGSFKGSDATRYQTIPASSMHSGGVNLLMADGAVRFVSNSIDRKVWRSVGSRNGGETIAAGLF